MKEENMENIEFNGLYNPVEKSIIKVIGVGGGGGNAVKHMYSEGIKGVEFLICNTDRQVLENNAVPYKLILGDSGLGAGAVPEVAREYAMNSKDKIAEFIGEETKMLFITAGMGKGTGTGAAPVIAEIAKEMGILTIGVVTFPFNFEGEKRKSYAKEGIEELKKHVDSLIVINNQNILKLYSDETADEAFGFADDVLKNAVKCIAELITVEADQNIDFKDIETVMKNSGPAMLGLATAKGENRIEEVVKNALSCPLLNESLITEAKNFLFFISYGKEAPLKISELDQLTEKFNNFKSSSSDVIWGRAVDESLGDSVKLSVIVTNYKVDSAPTNKTIPPATDTAGFSIGNKNSDLDLISTEPTVNPQVSQNPARKEPGTSSFPMNTEDYTAPAARPRPSQDDFNRDFMTSYEPTNYSHPQNAEAGHSQITQIGEFNENKFENNDAFFQLTDIPAIDRVRTQSNAQRVSIQDQAWLDSQKSDIHTIFGELPD